MSRDIDLSGYNDVSSRMREFFEKHPDGRLRPSTPWRVETIGDKAFIVYEAAAYRTADDPNPGIGTAWEPFPGRTPYTRDSELMNAETSAWGRAILAVGAADTKKGIASAEEVRNRQAERESWDEAKPVKPPREEELAKARAAILRARNEDELTAIARIAEGRRGAGVFTDDDIASLTAAIAVRATELVTEAA